MERNREKIFDKCNIEKQQCFIKRKNCLMINKHNKRDTFGSHLILGTIMCVSCINSKYYYVMKMMV